MKKVTTLLMTLCFLYSVDAQRVKEKDIIGTWQLVIDIEEEMEEEAEEADNFLEEVLVKSISGFVSGILEDIEIQFEFQEDRDVKITVRAYGEEERESAKWFINKRGYLQIEDWDHDDDDNFNISADDDEWRLVDGLLISDDNDDDERTVYMKKVDN